MASMSSKCLQVRRGSTAVEYALFLALIVGALVLASEAINFAMRDSLRETAAATRGGATAENLPSVDRAPPFLTSLVAPVDSPLQAYRVGVISLLLSLAACLWYGLYCRRLKPRPASVETLTEDQPLELRREEIFAKRQQILRILSSEMQSLLECRMEVRHLMSRKLLIVSPRTTLAEIHSIMNHNHVKHLLVCDEARKLCGIISDRDLLSRHGRTAADMMTAAPLVVEPQGLVTPAITLLLNKRISCLPVVENGVPVGVLTTTDMMMALQCAMQVLQKVASEIRQPLATNLPVKSHSAAQDSVACQALSGS